MSLAKKITVFLAAAMLLSCAPAEIGTMTFLPSAAISAEAAAALSAPKSFTAKSLNGVVILNWSAVSGAKGYKIYKSSDGKKYTLYKTVTDTTLVLTGLKAGEDYFFKAAAYSSSKSGREAADRVTVQSKFPAPTKIKTTPSKNKVVIRWATVSGAVGYRVYKYDSASKKYVKVSTVTGNDCTITGLTNGKKYSFKVAAVSKAGGIYYEGVRSAAVSAAISSYKEYNSEGYLKYSSYLGKGVGNVRTEKNNENNYHTNDDGSGYLRIDATVLDSAVWYDGFSCMMQYDYTSDNKVTKVTFIYKLASDSHSSDEVVNSLYKKLYRDFGAPDSDANNSSTWTVNYDGVKLCINLIDINGAAKISVTNA